MWESHCPPTNRSRLCFLKRVEAAIQASRPLGNVGLCVLFLAFSTLESNAFNSGALSFDPQCSASAMENASALNAIPHTWDLGQIPKASLGGIRPGSAMQVAAEDSDLPDSQMEGDDVHDSDLPDSQTEGDVHDSDLPDSQTEGDVHDSDLPDSQMEGDDVHDSDLKDSEFDEE